MVVAGNRCNLPKSAAGSDSLCSFYFYCVSQFRMLCEIFYFLGARIRREAWGSERNGEGVGRDVMDMVPIKFGEKERDRRVCA